MTAYSSTLNFGVRIVNANEPGSLARAIFAVKRYSKVMTVDELLSSPWERSGFEPLY